MPGNPDVIRDDSEIDGLASWKTTEVCQSGHVLQSLRIGRLTELETRFPGHQPWLKPHQVLREKHAET